MATTNDQMLVGNDEKVMGEGASPSGEGVMGGVVGEDWTAEVNMEEFYTDAATYWKV